jgi:hydrogenase nickel incorporation protein HypA/HybF
MHELSIAQSVLNVVSRSVPDDFSGKITAIHLTIGALSGIEQDALQFSFDIIKKNSPAIDAKLIINTVSGKALCQNCGTTFEMNTFAQDCPNCHQFKQEIIQGKELKIASIEYDE